MNNYHYIIASLPLLSRGTEVPSFDIGKIKQEVLSQCSAKDAELIGFFCKMLDGSNLDREYYSKALKSSSSLTRRFSNIDRQIRNMKVRQTAQALYDAQVAEGLIAKYVMEDEDNPYAEYREPTILDMDFSAEDREVLESVFSDKDIVSKERKLDDYKWNKIDSLTTFDYFNIDCILAFLAKGHLVSRWLKLDASKGKALFRKLVEEVRGTFSSSQISLANPD